MERITMNNGLSIPVLGLGVFRIPDKAQCCSTVLDAIKCGYRHIDTAAAYQNEDAVGDAVRIAVDRGICTREDLFITTKLWPSEMKNIDTAREAIEASFRRSGLEYFDMFLIHQALGDYFSGWRALEEFVEKGRIRTIGVSNFYPNILANFCETVDLKPAVNQIEIHPYYTQKEALDNMRHYKVTPEAWAPLGGGRYNPYNEPVLIEIAKLHGKTVAQIVLRFLVQQGIVVLPKSVHPERLRENADIFGFTLTDIEMALISGLDKGPGETRTKHLNPEFVRFCLGTSDVTDGKSADFRQR